MLTIALLLAAAQEKEPPSFAKDERVVATYYYIRDGVDPARDLAEMGKAGIDLAVVSPGPGSDALGPALESLESERKEFPRLALFLDPAPPADFDLTREEGRRRFVSTVAGFFAKIPLRHRGRVEGRTVVWLGPAPRGLRYDKASFEALGREDWSGLGGRPPFLVADHSWKDVPVDRTYAWGAGMGAPRELPVVSLGPGRERDEGHAYERAWYVALRLGAAWVALETWNGPETEIAESAANGRKLLDATRRFARKFKLGETTTLPKGKYTKSPKVLYTTVFSPNEQGLRPVPNDDGVVDRVRLGAFGGLTSKENGLGSRRHLYFDVDDSFCFFERRSLTVTVEFLDAGEGTFTLEYDSADAKLSPAERLVKRAGEVRFTGTAGWRMESFDLPDAVLGNGQKGGADFRIVVDRRGLTVRSVAVTPR